MNRGALLGAFLLAACAPTSDDIRLDLGQVEDYAEFLEIRDGAETPDPFKAEPLIVSATGKVRAQPDIAVITARIEATDKNESKAVDAMARTINAVQDALAGQQIETGFTAITSSRDFDEDCRNENVAAYSRHSQIQNDFWFNKNLDDRGDTETKRREPKPRIYVQVCRAEAIKVATQMVIRIQPADAAGDALRALSEAGAKNAQLFGYDFADYDSLYQEAAAKAVSQGRKKAEAIARGSGAELGEIETFTVGGPARTGRFGPQPNLIRQQPPYIPDTGSVLDRQTNRRFAPAPPPPPGNAYSGYGADEIVVTGSSTSSGYTSGTTIGQTGEILMRAMSPAQYETYQEPVYVQEASTELVTIPATYQTVYENGVARRVVKTPARTVERSVPGVTKMETRRRLIGPATPSSSSNALTMSLLSGPQDIEVRATLGYAYPTPLDGKVIVEPENG